MDDEARIFEPVLTEEMGSAGSFSFQIWTGHPYYDKLQPCRSEVVLYQNNEPVFWGRILKPEQDFTNMVSITCEGDLTYLLDSIQRPFDFRGTFQEYVAKLLEVHNDQVEADRQIVVGNLVAGSKIAERDWELTSFSPTLTVLRESVSDNGGYFRLRHDGEKRYLDYLWDYGGINTQVIRFGENLLDLQKYVDASQIITCLIVQGGDLEYEDETGEVQERTVDITSVNNGLDYIENADAVKQYGKIWGYQKFDDITDSKELLSQATAYLVEASTLPGTIEVSAADLSTIEPDTAAFHLGYWTTVSSAPHGIEQKFLLSKREINLLDPTQGSITLGRQTETLTGNVSKDQASLNSKVDQATQEIEGEIQRKIENASALITGGLGGYVVIDNIDSTTGKKSHPWRILIMNAPDKKAATNVIQINQNGIGFSTSGINGPYRNAWTIDGNLVADFVAAGTMLADRIRGGTLEVGGPGLAKNGVIRVLKVDGKEVCRLDQNGVSITDGVLNGPEIRGGFADFGDGLFYADSTSVSVGGFEARYDWGRDIFQSADEQCGLSANPNKKGSLWMWAGWQGADEYDFAVNNEGLCVARDFKCLDRQDFWKGWGLTDTLEDVYDRLDDLQDQIDNIDTGGD